MMPADSKQPEELKVEHSSEIERFIVFRFGHALGKGFKNRIKFLGCSWSALHHGWLCSRINQAGVEKAIQEAGLKCAIQALSLPKGMIPSDPKIAGRQSRLEILEEQIFREDTQLLQDVYRYDSTLRPEDFVQPISEEGKSPERIRIERDFHDRWNELQKSRKAADQARKELSHLSADSGEKVFDSGAPLLIADALIKEQFQLNEYRTLHFCSDTFWRWDGAKYVELSEGGMRQKIYGFLRDAKEPSREGHLENFNPNKFNVDQIIDALRAVCHNDHPPARGAIWLDEREGPDPQYLISFRNGLLNMEEWLENPHTFPMPHTPALMNVNALSFDFDPDAGEPLEWLRFLNSIWPDDLESQETLQEWMGYILTHDTRLHKILLIIGPTRCGKGTIGRCIREMLGDFNVIGPTLTSLTSDFGLQPFLNKMVAIISDARLSSKGNNSAIIERLLSISGEDPLTINRKFLPPLTVQLSTRIMMMSNEIPDMRDASGALAKRYTVLTLTKSWFGQEDTLLSQRLRAELSGILLWALRGLARLKKRGKLRQPVSSFQTIADLEAMTSPIKAFVSETCELNPKAMVPVLALFNAWRMWCGFTGYPSLGNSQSFGKNLRAAFPNIETTRPQGESPRERYYRGIQLISVPNPSADVLGPTEGPYQ